MTDVKPEAAMDTSWFGHPRQLARLFSTEACERFGFYGVRALLILYLTQHFAFSDRVSGGLYGAFLALVYLTPLIGGFVADQYFGSKRTVRLGAILMAVGYLMLAFSGGTPAKPFVAVDGHHYQVRTEGTGKAQAQYLIDGAQRFKIIGNDDQSITFQGASGVVPARVAKGHYRFDATRNPLNVFLLYLSLALVVTGNGFFKPNISTMVGNLYAEGDRRRDAGFTIFYMGINVGSILSQFSAPLVAAWFGFSWGFALPGVVMLVAWALFQFSGEGLKDFGNPPNGKPQYQGVILILTLLALPVFWFLLRNQAMAGAEPAASAGVVAYLMSLPLLGKLMLVIYAATMIGIPAWSLIKLDATARNRMIVAILLTAFSVVFWTLFEQAGSSLTLFADRNTDRHIAGMVMEAGQVQMFNPLFIVTLAPLLSWLWDVLGRRGLEPSVPLKFAIGLLLVGFGFLLLVFGAGFHDSLFRVGLFWLAAAYLLHSIGELCLSPVGLSMITKLSVQSVVGLMMGVWFLSIAMAEYIGGIIAQLTSTATVAGKVLNPEVSLHTYTGVFQTIGYAGVAAGVVMLLILPLLKRGMKGVH